MTSASTWPGPTRRKLVDVADDQKERLCPVLPSISDCISMTSTMEVPSTTKQVAVEAWVFVAAFEAASLRINLQHPVDLVWPLRKAGRDHPRGNRARYRAAWRSLIRALQPLNQR